MLYPNLMDFGIGRATALEFAKSGLSGIAITDKNLNGLTAVKEKIQSGSPNIDVLCLELHAESEDSIVSTFGKAVSHFGRVHYAANVAGVQGARKPSTATTLKEYRETIDINLIGVWISQREQLKHMIAQRPFPEGLVSVLTQMQETNF